MKPLWLIYVLVFFGTVIWFFFGQRQSKPPAEIAALEMARGNIERTLSCYSLDAVLTANRLDGTDSDVSAFWTTRVRDEWTMTVKRGKSWSAYTFIKEGEVMTPVRLAFSDDLPQDTGMEKAIGDLLEATANGSVPRMPRCGGG